MLNASAALHGSHDLPVEDGPVSESRAGQVLVEIGSAEICRAGVHDDEHARLGSYGVRNPMVIGHEPVGRVEIDLTIAHWFPLGAAAEAVTVRRDSHAVDTVVLASPHWSAGARP